VRGVLAKVLVGLGAFLLATAALALLWVPGQVKKTPLDVDSTTRLTGTATLGSGSAATTSPIKVTSISRTDSKLSTDDVALFVNSTCAVKDEDGKAPDCVSPTDPDKRLISASEDTFATDRRTAEAVEFDALPADAEPKTGLINKFPFDVEQRTYPFWDGSAKKAVDAVFEGEEEVEGVNLYKFTTTVKGAPVEIAAGVKGTYDDVKTMWIEPATGSIMDQEEHRILKQNGTPVIDLKMAFTDEQVSKNIEDGKANAATLKLLTGTVPMVAGLLGLVSLVGGLIAARGASSRRRDEEAMAYADEADDPTLLDGLDDSTRRRDIHS
jgi:hypothetical protein